jgi:hypothetical protein
MLEGFSVRWILLVLVASAAAAGAGFMIGLWLGS